MNIQIKNRYNNKVIFEYDCEDNTIRKTVQEAIKAKVSLVQANLAGVNLKNINFNGVNLKAVNFSDSDLEHSTFDNACLVSSYFGFTNLRYVDFRKADLSGVNFVDSIIEYADFRESDLTYARFEDAIIRCSTFKSANLTGANFKNASLRIIVFDGAINIPYIASNLPTGEFIAWKKCQNKIIKLKILEDSKRSKALSDKCRCDKALVLGFEELNGTPITDITEIVNTDYTECHYKVGKIVYADKWDDNRWNECSNGIHFFIDRQSAVEY